MANMSQRAIASTWHISTKSVAAVWRKADELGISLADVADKTPDEVYTLFFPEKFQKETVYAPVDYEYVHNELKKPGVTLKLLWQEHKGDPKGSVPVGYTKFCDDYAKYIEQNNLTNHITYKPGVVCEVDWSGKTMRLHAPDEDKVYPVYLFVATLPYSQLAYVEPCLDVKEQSWINCNIHMFEYFGGVTLRIVCENLKTRVFNSCDEGVQFSATAMFILLRRKCSFRAAEMFNLGRHIQFSEKPDEDHQWSEQDIFEQMRKIIRKHE